MARTTYAGYHTNHQNHRKSIVPNLEQTTLHLHAISLCSLYCVILTSSCHCFQFFFFFSKCYLWTDDRETSEPTSIQRHNSIRSSADPSNIRNQSHKFIQFCCCRSRSITAIVFQIKRLQTITPWYRHFPNKYTSVIKLSSRRKKNQQQQQPLHITSSIKVWRINNLIFFPLVQFDSVTANS